MKNLKLIALLLSCFLFSSVAFSQGFTSFGKYTSSSTADGNIVYVELNANGTAYMEIDGVPQTITHFAYDPSISNYIKFKAIPNVSGLTDAIQAPAFRSGLFEPMNNGKWRLQLNDFGQAPPSQFNTDEIILDFDPN